jgi:hypothetical protein
MQCAISDYALTVANESEEAIVNWESFDDVHPRVYHNGACGSDAFPALEQRSGEQRTSRDVQI